MATEQTKQLNLFQQNIKCLTSLVTKTLQVVNSSKQILIHNQVDQRAVTIHSDDEGFANHLFFFSQMIFYFPWTYSYILSWKAPYHLAHTPPSKYLNFHSARWSIFLLLSSSKAIKLITPFEYHNKSIPIL